MIATRVLPLFLLVGLASGGEVRERRAVGLAASADGSRLFVANRRSGSVSVVDPVGGKILFESDVGRGFADLTGLPDGRLLAVDAEAGALLVLKVGPESVAVEARFLVAADPASVLARPDGSGCVVASTASHRLSVVALPLDASGQVTPRLERAIVLPFAPRLLAWAEPGQTLVVADSVGGRIAVVDPAVDRVASVRSIPGHNIRGLAATPDGRSLVVAHQSASKLARTSFEDVHWGSLVGNHLRILARKAVLDPVADLLDGSRLVDLGRTGRAAGDPASLAIDHRGRLSVALTGVHEVALIADLASASQARRVGVGQGPSAVLASSDGTKLYVLDGLDDTITVVDVAAGAKSRTIALGPRPDLDAVARGERLFADARLSHDGWMSCRSCHTDGGAGALTIDTLADGGFGAPKRVTSLRGVGSTGPWTWLGAVDRLEDQVRKSIESTMRGRPPSTQQVDDLTAYLRSLPPPGPVAVAVAETDEEAVGRGQAIFRARKCAECHAPPSYTSEGAFDVGLVDEAGHRAFNPPSLRGVGDRAPYLHDGRAATLAEVFLRHGHPRGSSWSPAEVEALAAFLRTL